MEIVFIVNQIIDNNHKHVIVISDKIGIYDHMHVCHTSTFSDLINKIIYYINLTIY